MSGGAAHLGWPFSVQTLLRGAGKPAGKGCVLPWAISSGFPSTSGLQLPPFLGPSPLLAPAPSLPAPRPSAPTTHAEGQQKNVEQELDTLHSSFHRHGCWAWGRGKHRDRIRPRGHRLGSSPPALAAFPARPPPRPFPPGNPRSDPRLPVPSARRPHRGGGRAASGTSGSQEARRARPGTVQTSTPAAAAQHRSRSFLRRIRTATPAGRRPAPKPALGRPRPRSRQGLPSPGGGAPGAPRASPTSRQSCSRARASSRLLSGVWARVPPGRPRGPSAPAAPASPALPDVARCSPAAGQPPSPRLRPPLAPRLPRGPAPAPASPLPRGVAASLPRDAGTAAA